MIELWQAVVIMFSYQKDNKELSNKRDNKATLIEDGLRQLFCVDSFY
jgi:hypothetical protein